ERSAPCWPIQRSVDGSRPSPRRCCPSSGPPPPRRRTMATTNKQLAAKQLAAGKAVTEEQVREIVRGWVDRDYRGSLTDAAKSWKLSKSYLSHYLAGRRKLGPAIQRVAGLRREV